MRRFMIANPRAITEVVYSPPELNKPSAQDYGRESSRKIPRPRGGGRGKDLLALSQPVPYETKLKPATGWYTFCLPKWSTFRSPPAPADFSAFYPLKQPQ